MSTLLLIIGLVYLGQIIFKKLDTHLMDFTAVKLLIKTAYMLPIISIVLMIILAINSDGSFGAGVVAGLVFWIGLLMCLILLMLSGFWFAVSKIIKQNRK